MEISKECLTRWRYVHRFFSEICDEYKKTIIHEEKGGEQKSDEQKGDEQKKGTYKKKDRKKVTKKDMTRRS